MLEKKLINKLKEWFITSELVTPEEYNDYIKEADFDILAGGEYVIVVNSKLAKSWLLNIHAEIENGFTLLCKKPVKVILMEISEYQDKKTFDNIKNKNKGGGFSKFTFENYISGDSNKNAIQAAYDVIERPGVKWNPLFIHGDSGLGKTHLLGAIYNCLQTKYPNINVKYVSSNDFRKEIIGALNGGYEKIEEAKEKFSQQDFLLIDDVQFLANSGKTNEILFNIFNSLIEKNSQIILSSDKSPEKLNGFEDRLVSRFSQGLRVKLDTLDTQIKHKIIRFKANIAGIKLSDSAVTYIANCHANDVRRIEGSINMISFAFLNQSDRVLEYEDVYELLRSTVYAPGSELTAQKIKDVVAEKYGTTAKLLESKTRLQKVATPRHVAMYLIHDLLKFNQTEIGILFGSRDHSTIAYAITNIQKKIDGDKSFKEQILKMKKEITS